MLIPEWMLGQNLSNQTIIFFFSSRRRHTRSYGDWSSDVCSSDLAEFQDSGSPRNFRRHPSAQIIVRLHLYVRFELVCQIRSTTVTEKDDAEPDYHPANSSHCSSPRNVKNRAMISFARCHSRSWATNSFFPAFVILAKSSTR